MAVPTATSNRSIGSGSETGSGRLGVLIGVIVVCVVASTSGTPDGLGAVADETTAGVVSAAAGAAAAFCGTGGPGAGHPEGGRGTPAHEPVGDQEPGQLGVPGEQPRRLLELRPGVVDGRQHGHLLE